MADPPSPNPTTSNVFTSSSSPMLIDRSEDSVLSKSQFLTRLEVLRRRSRRVKQLAKIYGNHYWCLLEELKLKYRDYYWEYGMSPFQQDHHHHPHNDDNNGDTSAATPSRCGIHGCKAKAMALTNFCHMHILSDAKQKLYKPCSYAVKSSPTGPIFCGKPILRSTVPSLCSQHFQKAEKHVARALKKAGLNVTSSTSKQLAPKFHVIVAEYVHQIQSKRRAAHKASLEGC